MSAVEVALIFACAAAALGSVCTCVLSLMVPVVVWRIFKLDARVEQLDEFCAEIGKLIAPETPKK